jgi:seryl-tRNA synthetase
MAEGDTEDEADTLDRLLQSCASITETALSCRTRPKNDTSIDANIQKDRDFAKWLDRKVLERSSMTFVLPAARSITSAEAHHDLIKKSATSQLEHALLTRIMAAKVARQSPSSPSTMFIQQAVSSRDQLVVDVLRQANRITDLQTKERQLDDDIHTLQTEIKELYHQSTAVRENKTDVTTDMNGETDDYLLKENKRLHTLITDLLECSDLDWYGDDRLRAMAFRIKKYDVK